MATGSNRGRKPSAQNRKSSTKNSNKKRNYNQKSSNPGILDEILIFIFLGLSILLFLGCLGLLGSFGGIIKKVLIGLLGMPAFIFPIAFFFVCFIGISKNNGKASKVKIASTLILVWMLSCFCQLIFAKDVYVTKLGDYFTDKAKNGGFLGGITTHFLCKFLGMPGTIVILIVAIIICIVLLTDKSIFASVKEGSKRINEDYRRNKAYRQEMNEIHNIDRERRELERSARRAKKYEESVEKQEKKRAAQLEEKRKRAIEKFEKASENMILSRTDLRTNGFGDANLDSQVVSQDDEIVEEINDDLSQEIYDSDVLEEGIEAPAKGPESMFYGRRTKSNSHWSETAVMPDTQAIIKSTSDALAISEAGDNLFSATKLTRNAVNGEMVEITENYCTDDEFIDYINKNLSTSHKITINPEEEAVKQDAYERDMYVEDAESFEKEYEDVANLFANRRERIAGGGHHINVNMTSDVESNTGEDSERDYSDDYVDVYSDEIFYEDSKKDLETDLEEDKFDKRAVIKKSVNGLDLAQENAKPAPVSQVISSGKSVKAKRNGKYKLPPVSLLNEVRMSNSALNAEHELNETALELKETLHNFGLDVTIIGSSRGPAVTRYEIQMPTGVSVKKITNLSDDIMMSLGAKDIRIEAPIPGKKAVGIELPNRESTMVHFKELIDSKIFKNFDSKVAFGVGKDLSGDIVVTDIAKMPHLLIAGATGSGKSVCINTLIMSILFKAHPDEVKLIMIDPKMVELSIYNDIPHLLIPVVTDPKKASAALNWAVNEMTERYQKFSQVGVRDMKGYNAKIQSDPSLASSEEHKYMPQIVIVVDELADLMMVASKEVEESICRLAQLARAAGIYLILATQRPSVDVITGLIKANMPSRIAFSVSSGVDSRTILDMLGAEKLLGNGDMLFFPRGYNKPARVQGAFVSDDEVQRVVDYVKEQSGGDSYDEAAINAVNAAGANTAAGSGGLVDPQGAYDELFTLAGHAVIESDKASIGMLQRKFKIGFNRAARIMDQLSDEGVVGPEEGTKPRRILMSMEQFNNMLEEKNHQ